MTTQSTRMHAPAHPGAILRELTIPGLKLTPQEAAAQLGVPLDDLVRVLNAEAPVSAELAVRIEAWLSVDHGGRAEFWLQMQAQYDLWNAQQREGHNVKLAPSADAPQSSRNSQRCPTHPGEILREDVIPALKLTPQGAATLLGVPLDDLMGVLDGTAPVTAEFAARIEAWLGVDHGGDAEFWLAMQAKYDLWKARRRGLATEVVPALGRHPSTKPEALRKPQNNMRPVHPGEVLRQDFMAPASMDAATFAAELNIPRADLDAILAEQQSVTFEIASRITDRFGGDVASWLAMQAEYDEKAAKPRWRYPTPEREAEIQRGIAQDPDAAEGTPEMFERMAARRRAFVGPPRPRKSRG